MNECLTTHEKQVFIKKKYNQIFFPLKTQTLRETKQELANSFIH